MDMKASKKTTQSTESPLKFKIQQSFFISDDSMVKVVNGYLLTKSINRKYIVLQQKQLKWWITLNQLKEVSAEVCISPYCNKWSVTRRLTRNYCTTSNWNYWISEDQNNVVVSNIKSQRRKRKVKDKALYLEKCVSVIINHSNINSKGHLNRSKLGIFKRFYLTRRMA